jgi:hypothetical protein
MLPSDRVLKHQYRAKNYQRYSELIHDLLQTDKHDEPTMRNHHQHPVGTAPLPEVNCSSKGKTRQMVLNDLRMLANSRKARKISTRRTNPKTKVQKKERNLSSVTAVVVLIILQRNAKYSNT